MRRYQKKVIFIAAIFLICSIFGFIYVDKVFAEDAADSTKVDVVFVIDASKSMKTSDPEGLTGEAMKMFIDMSHSKGDKAGMVAYSDKIVREYALRPMNSEEDKSLLKNTLTGLELGNWTDIGMGLKRAVSLLKDGQDKNNKPIIILLSDGKNDPQRDKKASQDDLTTALNEAKAQNFPVYTIGLNADGTVDKNQLEAISKETNAKNFITNNAEELPRILREIFADNSKLKALQETTITGNDKFQDVKITIPDSNIAEANISILSSKPVEIKLSDSKGQDIKIPSEKILYTTSNHYSIVKLISPEKGDWLLKVRGSNADKVNISLISNYDLKAGIKLNPDSNFHKGDKVQLSAYLESNGYQIEDLQFYSSLKASANVKNLNNGEIKEIPMKLQGNAFTGEYTLTDDNKYDIKVKLEGPGFIRESEVKNITTDNRIPIIANKTNSLTLWSKKIKEINLNNYFKDEDNDILSYSVSSSNINPLNLKILGNNLIVQDGKWGSNSITITADDGKGGKVSTELVIKYYPLFYIAIGASASIILTLLVISILSLFKRNKGVGLIPKADSDKHKRKKLRKGSYSGSYIEDTQTKSSKASILEKIEQSKFLYERKICEEIAYLHEDERIELFSALKGFYIATTENFCKASYLIYNYANINFNNFDIVQVMRSSIVDYAAIDNLIKYIMSIKGLPGVIRYLNHLSKYREDYDLENSYFQEILSVLIHEYNLNKNPGFRKLNRELLKVVKDNKKAASITHQAKSAEIHQ